MIKEIKGDLFSYKGNGYLAHCISSDFAMGAGIAVEFNKRYNMRSTLLRKHGKGTYPSVIVIENVFNLITKNRYWNKPTYTNFFIAVDMMFDIAKGLNIKEIAMPRIGCGLDKLDWDKVYPYLNAKAEEYKINVIVHYL